MNICLLFYLFVHIFAYIILHYVMKLNDLCVWIIQPCPYHSHHSGLSDIPASQDFSRVTLCYTLSTHCSLTWWRRDHAYDRNRTWRKSCIWLHWLCMKTNMSLLPGTNLCRLPTLLSGTKAAAYTLQVKEILEVFMSFYWLLYLLRF